MTAPVGSILNVERPAPVCARHIIGQFLPEVVLGCLADIMPDLVPAEGASCNWGLQLRGIAERRPFNILFFNAGGTGARPSQDGLSATSFPSGIRSIPVEICETVAPIVIHRKELIDSGGKGRYRGGLGQRVEVGTIDGSPFELFAVFDRVDHPARGRAGGMTERPDGCARSPVCPCAPRTTNNCRRRRRAHRHAGGRRRLRSTCRGGNE